MVDTPLTLDRATALERIVGHTTRARPCGGHARAPRPRPSIQAPPSMSKGGHRQRRGEISRTPTTPWPRAAPTRGNQAGSGVRSRKAPRPSP
eukprot:13693043-Alexandrium_andersonii.AAC.1